MRLLPLLAALLCLLTLAGGGACGGDGDKDVGGGANELTLDEYYQQLAAAIDTLAADVSAVADEAATNTGDAGIDERKQIATSFITDFAAAFVSFAEEAGGLEPPVGVVDAHAELIDATNDVLDAANGLLDQVDAAQSQDELLEALFSDEAVAAAGQRSETACNELQSIAGDNNIDVQLNCGLE
jgi:hypothetical protein